MVQTSSSVMKFSKDKFKKFPQNGIITCMFLNFSVTEFLGSHVTPTIKQAKAHTDWAPVHKTRLHHNIDMFV